jgi:hypothetical protein
MGLAAILATAIKDILLPIIEEQIAKASAEPTMITADVMQAKLVETGAYERLANATVLALLPPDTL